MTHFGLLCPAMAGHLNPMTTLGHELKRRGHRVTLFGVLDAQPKTLAVGLEFWAIGEEEFPTGASDASFSQMGKLSGLAAPKYSISLFRQLTAMLLREAPQAIKAAGVEVLIVDQTSYGGGTVADFLKLPFISVCCALMLNQEPAVPPIATSWSYNPAWWAQLRNQFANKSLWRIAQSILEVVAEYRREWKLPPHFHFNDAFSQLAQICQQPAEFEFPRQHLPQCFHFNGPYHDPASRESTPFPFEKLTGKPLIYASMGTLQNRLRGRVFENIAQACVGLDAQLVIALGGGSSPESLPELPGTPLVVGYAPQLELLQQATLTITHAGLNTTLESLSNGVPMVAIPITHEQPGVAARIAWTGTGEVVPLAKLSASRLHKAVQRLLTEDTYKQNALRLQTAIRRAGGVHRAADIVEQVVQTGQPVLA